MKNAILMIIINQFIVPESRSCIHYLKQIKKIEKKI